MKMCCECGERPRVHGSYCNPCNTRLTRERWQRNHPHVEPVPRTEKICGQCKKIKPMEEFARNGRTLEGRSSYCAECHRARARRPADRERARINSKSDVSKKRRNERLRLRRLNDPEYAEHLRQLTRERNRRHGYGRGDPSDKETQDYRLILQSDVCSYCGGPSEEIDHITAVKLGGSNHWSNLTASCRSCNRRKQKKPLLVFLAQSFAEKT